MAVINTYYDHIDRYVGQSSKFKLKIRVAVAVEQLGTLHILQPQLTLNGINCKETNWKWLSRNEKNQINTETIDVWKQSREE